jgi:hypothetical protein
MKKIYLTFIAVFVLTQFTYAQWNTSGTNIYNSNTGNVGIGVTTPTSTFQVAQQTTGLGTVSTTASGTTVTGTGTQFTNTFKVGDAITANGETHIISVVSSDFLLTTDAWTSANTTVAYTLAGGTRFVIKGNGNIGLGTVSPKSTLQVAGDARFGTNGSYADLRLFTDVALSGYNQTNSLTPTTTPGSGLAKAALYLKNAISAGTTRMDLLVDGNVGIGTTNPIVKLQVGQDIAGTTSSIYATGTNGNGFIINAGAHYGAMFPGSNLINFGFPSSIGSQPTPIMSITYSGNVGIGTTSPNALFHASGPEYIPSTSGSSQNSTLRIGANTTNLVLDAGVSTSGSYSWLQSRNQAVYSANYTLALNPNGGSVSIGITDPKGYKLAVAGNVIAESVTVKLQGSWPDYVFKPSYDLPSLTDVKVYIDKNQHLPEMPSEREIVKNGINLGELVKLQTKKIEELTLYLIEKDRQFSEQQKAIQSLQGQINELSKQQSKKQ